MFDRDMRYVAASSAWVSKYKMPKDFEGLSHYEIFPNIPERWKEAHRRGLSGETIIQKNDGYDLPSGEHLTVDWALSPWRWENDNAIGGISIVSADSERARIGGHASAGEVGTLHDFFMSLPVAYQSLDILGNWLDANQKMADLLGFDNREQMLGLNFIDYWSTEPKYESPFERFKQSGELNSEQTLIRRDGAPVTVLIVGQVERDAAGNFVRTHCALFDFSERKKIENEIARLNVELEHKVEVRTKQLEDANRALQELARLDPLTGLANRLAANERLESEFALFGRSGICYSVIMIDIDFFKAVNDSFGHAIGDVVLQKLSKIFVESLGSVTSSAGSAERIHGALASYRLTRGEDCC